MIEISNLTVTYGSGATATRALDSLSLSIGAGEWLTVIGSNGSGKSTLLGAIAGAVRPVGGGIAVDGRDVTGTPPWRRAAVIGRVFQNPTAGTAPTMTVVENLRLAALRGERRRLRVGLTAAERRGLAERIAALGMGLEKRLDTPMGLLSGGQRQALTLLAATLRTPRLLLLDEHTAALDPGTADMIMELTQRLVEESRITTLMVTHDMEHAAGYGTRVVMMERGRVAGDWSGPDRSDLTPPRLFEKFVRLRQHGQHT